MEDIEQKSNIKCQLCGKEFPIITPSHLKRKHGIGLVDYREKFPDAPITSVEYKTRQRFLKGNLFKSDENPIVDDIDFTKLELNKDDNLDIESITKVKMEPPTFKETPEEPPKKVKDVKQYLSQKSNILPNKQRILDFLETVFPPNTVINNYMIDLLGTTGLLKFQTITDIAIPYKKIDFEFPKTFWHNSGIPDPFRNLKLEREGWIVITINTMTPSVDEVKQRLENRKLI